MREKEARKEGRNGAFLAKKRKEERGESRNGALVKERKGRKRRKKKKKEERGEVQEYGILPHSRTYYCLLFSLYHMFIVFVISY